MRLKRMRLAALLLFGVGLMASACQRGPTAETPTIPYHLVDVTTHIDQKTGNIVRVALWNYDDGYVTTTTDELPAGSPNHDGRAGPPSPGLRFEP